MDSMLNYILSGDGTIYANISMIFIGICWIALVVVALGSLLISRHRKEMKGSKANILLVILLNISSLCVVYVFSRNVDSELIDKYIIIMLCLHGPTVVVSYYVYIFLYPHWLLSGGIWLVGILDFLVNFCAIYVALKVYGILGYWGIRVIAYASVVVLVASKILGDVIVLLDYLLL